MKRYGNLWAQIINFENILRVARQAQPYRDRVVHHAQCNVIVTIKN